jgi:hypothetical protein
VSVRERTQAAVEGGRREELEALVAEEPRALRYLVALSYQTDETVRWSACRGIGIAGHYHPELVQKIVRRLVWAMNDESGTNALTAPGVVRAIAEERPSLLLPMVPDLTRLAADPGLQEELAAALKVVQERCPGEIGRRLGTSLGKRLDKRRKKGRAGGCG